MMVIDAYAVVDPWTMVVKAFNTLIADAAVPRTLCSNDLAIWTQQNWVEVLHHGL